MTIDGSLDGIAALIALLCLSDVDGRGVDAAVVAAVAGDQTATCTCPRRIVLRIPADSRHCGCKHALGGELGSAPGERDAEDRAAEKVKGGETMRGCAARREDGKCGLKRKRVTEGSPHPVMGNG